MNITSNDEKVSEWNNSLSTGLLPDSIILVIYMVVGLIGNAVVVFIHKYRLKKISDDRYFIPYLAIVDLLSCLLNTSFSISVNSLPVKYENGTTCKTLWFLCMAFTALSALMLVIIAIHRYLKICRPFGPQMKVKQKRIAIIVVGVISVLISWPCFIFYGPKPVHKSDDKNITGYRCTSIRGPWTTTEPLVFKAFVLITSVICIMVLIVSYTLIWRVIHRQFRFRKAKSAPNTSSTDETVVASKSQQQREENQEPPISQDRDHGTSVTEMSETFDDIKQKKGHDQVKKTSKDSEIRFTILFMLITSIFILSYIPKIGMMVYESRHENFWAELSHHELGGYRFLYTFFIINNIVNPFMYGYFDKQFRDEFKRMFCKCCK